MICAAQSAWRTHAFSLGSGTGRLFHSLQLRDLAMTLIKNEQETLVAPGPRTMSLDDDTLQCRGLLN